MIIMIWPSKHTQCNVFPVAQMVEHGASSAKIMGSIPREARADKM